MKTFKISSVVGILFLAVAFTVSAGSKMPGPDPAGLWEYITITSDYTSWDFWPDHKGMQPGRAPHGSQHKVYVNDTALNASGVPLDYGAIVVKENYNDAGELKAVTVMYKIEGYNPKDGDWFWAKYTPGGEANPFGKPNGCIGCHGTRANNDFVIVHDLE